jgi:formylglycine-generating enzyme required for sulfatase activity
VDPAARPLDREDRIAALTHLPWLREGSMPVWLRRALIQELARSGRADEVREALKSLIEEARQQGERRHEDDVVLRIAREQPKEGFDPERLYDDEVLLDFMARGRVEDFALPRRTWLEAILPRGLLDRIGVPGLVAGGVALVYAAAAWWVAPKLSGAPWGVWGDTREALPTGAWLPLALLCLGALGALALVNAAGTVRLFRTLLVRGAAPALALSFLLLVLAAVPRIALLAGGLAEASTLALAVMALLLARRIAAWLWIIEPATAPLRPRKAAGLLAAALCLSFIAWIGYEIAASLPFAAAGQIPISSYSFTFAAAATASLVLFACGWWLARRPATRAEPASGRLRGPWSRIVDAARVATALLLIVPAILTAHSVSTTSIVLERAAPGSAVVAETADGRFFAIGGADGRVQVYDTQRPSERRKPIETGLGPIASLTLALRNPRALDHSLILAAAGADGRVTVRSVDDQRVPAHFDWVNGSSVVSTGQAAQVALGSGGRLLIAVEDDAMPARLIAGDGPGRELALTGRGAVTALAALDDEHFAVATMDGAISVVAVSGSITLSAPSALRFSDSRARRLTYDARRQRLTALGDDGMILTASLEPGGALREGGGATDPKAALGPAVPWQRGRLVCTDGMMVSATTAAGIREPRCIRAAEPFRDCPTCPEMVVVPPGRFIMGSPASEQGRGGNEGPQREVTIRQPFGVGRFEVTFDEWDACAAAGGCSHRPSDQGWGRGRQPVVNVSWDDAQQYAAWLSRRTGVAYRLLTEAEWEYAARAGSRARWSFGDNEAELGEHAWYSANANRRARPVGGKRANAFGLHDMHGNAWEWVADCSGGSYEGAPVDGSAQSGTSNCNRRLRGGTWDKDPARLRAAFRDGIDPGVRRDDIGFRLARTLPPTP